MNSEFQPQTQPIQVDPSEVFDVLRRSMLVDGFVSSPSGSGILDSTGHQTLTVGATLHVNPNQADGDYTGTFPVTVTYN